MSSITIHKVFMHESCMQHCLPHWQTNCIAECEQGLAKFALCLVFKSCKCLKIAAWLLHVQARLLSGWESIVYIMQGIKDFDTNFTKTTEVDDERWCIWYHNGNSYDNETNLPMVEMALTRIELLVRILTWLQGLVNNSVAKYHSCSWYLTVIFGKYVWEDALIVNSAGYLTSGAKPWAWQHERDILQIYKVIDGQYVLQDFVDQVMGTARINWHKLMSGLHGCHEEFCTMDMVQFWAGFHHNQYDHNMEPVQETERPGEEQIPRRPPLQYICGFLTLDHAICGLTFPSLRGLKTHHRFYYVRKSGSADMYIGTHGVLQMA